MTIYDVKANLEIAPLFFALYDVISTVPINTEEQGNFCTQAFMGAI
jgi:hypothetical protein